MNYGIPLNLQCCNEHEMRLPRGFTCIIIALIYHPPCSDCHSIINNLFQCLPLSESLYPNCGIIIAGDFNRLNVGSFQASLQTSATG